ncbi:hypothetical protein ACFE04_004377 [Oxalis oulophora]
MFPEIAYRETGKTHPNSFTNRIKHHRINNSNLQLSNYKEIISPHKGSINSLQLDSTESRYLLSAASDASISIFDVQQHYPSSSSSSSDIHKHSSLVTIDKQQHQHDAHKFSVSSAIWYPVDTGLFVSASYDHFLKLWDTNVTKVVMNFKMPGKVYTTAMSSLATSHMLIAAGTEDVQVRLCDVASGAFAHTLSGHRDGVMSVEWSKSSEWVLMTGGCDGAIRFWDIRRAGCFCVLDQTQTQLGRRPPVLERSVTNKALMTKSTSASQSSVIKPRGPQRKSGIKQSGGKGFIKQRLHPGTLSVQDRATAHYGAVTGLKTTEDGMYLLSAGSDSRIRLWDVESGCNTLVNFETVRLQTTKTIQLATTQDSALVFVPCMGTVKGFDIWSGTTCQTFRAHYESVNCCWFNSQDQELYTGGNDRQILVWSPPRLLSDEAHDQDEDNWSD